MKKILLLGAGGFVGSHLAIELLKRGSFEITALDITHEKLDEGLRLAALFELDGQAHPDVVGEVSRIVSDIRYVDLDILDPAKQAQLKELIAANDIIVNLVAICNPAVYVTDPIYTFDVGFRGNLAVFDYCVEQGKRLIQFSTSEVYGKSPSIYVKDASFAFNEETSNLIMGPINRHRWIYASGKQLLERIIHAYGLKRDFHYSVIRPFNYIGEMIDYLPSQQSGSPRVFSHFMDALLNSTPVKLVNGGQQKRCYTYIKDATEAHVRIIEKEKECDKQIFNVGTNANETSIHDLAHRMRDIYEKHFRLPGQERSPIISVSGTEFYGEGYDDIDRRLLDNAKLVKLTGWEPKYNLDDMLFRIMSYYVEQVRTGAGSTS